MSASLYTQFSANLALQEAQINSLEQQISTGVAVQTPDQNPAAFETASIADDQISALTNDGSTQSSIQAQLGSVANVYSSVGTLFSNVQSIVEQALNGTTSSQQSQELATQITSAGQQLLSLGNSTGPDGTYLFGGSRATVAPFQTGANGSVVYYGDGGQSAASIAPGLTASTLASGQVFTDTLAGNGYGIATASAGNTGTATLLSEGVTQPATASAFQSGNAPISISFSSGATGLTYTATQNGNTLASGAATSGATVQVAGMDFQLNGTPAANDSFTITPSRPQSAFSLLQNIATTLSSASGSPAAQAQNAQALNNDLSSLAQYQQTLLTAQAQNGVTLQAVANAGTSNSNQQTMLQTTVQNATGANIPAAMTSLDETLTAVQASEQAFGAVQKLSLFNYI